MAGFLQYGDDPRGSWPLRGWVGRSRLGGVIAVVAPAPPPPASFGGASVGPYLGQEKPIKKFNDDEEVLEILTIIMRTM